MSDIIHLLPDSVANQIAAGEVIQRPASAVKELLENSIDAGADQIQLIIKDAGKTLIQIIDNGKGMTETDARKCFERHATSKISNAADLFSIRTMGFRGEALASIAAIAQVELKTKDHDSEIGTRVVIEGSKIIEHNACSASAGTSLAIKNLFFNVPARRNFLKSNTAETRHIIEEFQRIALVNPAIDFSFFHNGKPVFQIKSSNLKQRIVALFGKSYNERLVPVEQETSDIKINGYIGKPEYARKTRGEQYFFVNGRFIKHPYFHHAIVNAFSELLPQDAIPSYFIYFEVDPSEIDINIHPTKTEVNFQDSKLVYTILVSVIKQALGKYSITPTIDFDVEKAFDLPLGELTDLPAPPTITINPDYNPFENSHYDKKPLSEQDINNSLNWPSLDEQSDINQRLSNDDEQSFHRFDFGSSESTQLIESRLEDNEGSRSRSFFQLNNQFIVTSIKSGLLLLEQNRAHERIIYERVLKRSNKGSVNSQQLLFPVTMQFNPGDASLMEELLEDLTRFGFNIDKLGQNNFIIQGTPSNIPAEHIESLVEEILEQCKLDYGHEEFSRSKTLARSMAGNLAMKCGKRLQFEEMQEIVDQLFACDIPDLSPSGKRIIEILSLEELNKRFAINSFK